MASLFISYRRSDSHDATGRIHDSLTEHFGSRSVFKDVDSIPLSVPFPAFVQDALSKAQAVLVVIGPSWLAASDSTGRRRLDDPNDLVRIEIETSLRIGVPTIPITVTNAAMPRESDLPESIRLLATLNGQPLRPDPDFHQDILRLVKRLEHIGVSRTMQRESTPTAQPPDLRVVLDSAMHVPPHMMDHPVLIVELHNHSSTKVFGLRFWFERKNGQRVAPRSINPETPIETVDVEAGQKRSFFVSGEALFPFCKDSPFVRVVAIDEIGREYCTNPADQQSADILESYRLRVKRAFGTA